MGARRVRAAGSHLTSILQMQSQNERRLAWRNERATLPIGYGQAVLIMRLFPKKSEPQVQVPQAFAPRRRK